MLPTPALAIHNSSTFLIHLFSWCCRFLDVFYISETPSALKLSLYLMAVLLIWGSVQQLPLYFVSNGLQYKLVSCRMLTPSPLNVLLGAGD